MNPFRTEIQIRKSKFRLSHQTPMLFIGSCFTENIGIKLQNLAFPVLINPTGIVYNPLSVKKSVEILLNRQEYGKDDLSFYNELFFSFDHDTSFSHPFEKDCLDKINTPIRQAGSLLKKASFMLITFGTSWVYLRHKDKRLVSNCHKIPAGEFERKLLDVDEIADSYNNLIPLIRSVNPDIKFIFTISPVRHWKDGATGNQVSKSTLVLAINKILSAFPEITEYFPAYELLLDDLRDYRFYANDLLHPSDMAIDYIWEKFTATFFDPQTKDLIREINPLLLARTHRLSDVKTSGRENFLRKHLQLTLDLKNKYPFLDFSAYEEYFRHSI